jgi:hypothetical protein
VVQAGRRASSPSPPSTFGGALNPGPLILHPQPSHPEPKTLNPATNTLPSHIP